MGANTMRLGLLLFAFAALFLPSAPSAQQKPAKPLVAVLDLEVRGGTDEQAVALSNQLRSELLKTGRFTLVDRSQLDAILDEQAFQQKGCTSRECAIEVGRILGIRQIVAGTVTRIDRELWQVATQLIDVETTETLRAETLNHSGPYRDLLNVGMHRMANLLAQVPLADSRSVAIGVSTSAESPSLDWWRAKWIAALAIGFAAGYYGYSESQAVADANDDQKAILADMETATTQAEYDALLEKLESEENTAKEHRRNSELGYAAAALALGAAVWIYFDPPDANKTATSWMPLIVPSREGIGLAVVTRW